MKGAYHWGSIVIETETDGVRLHGPEAGDTNEMGQGGENALTLGHLHKGLHFEVLGITHQCAKRKGAEVRTLLKLNPPLSMSTTPNRCSLVQLSWVGQEGTFASLYNINF